MHTRQPQFLAPRRHPPSGIHAPAVTVPRKHLQTHRPPSVVVGQPLQEETREAPSRVGCKCTGPPGLQDCLGAPAQCPHTAAGGRHRWAEDRALLALLWAGGVRGPLAVGQVGAHGEGLGIELHLLLSALLPGPGHLALATDPGFTFPSLSKGPGSSGVSMPPPSPLPLLTPAHSLEMELDLETTFHPQDPWPGYYCIFLIYCNSFTWDKFFFQMNSKVSYLNHNL